ncbi:MAG: 1-(5-phosphoribosyl)-5-[(5-phosphoribosylamino)methylideneamino]imidazole-4-carboxamide isomerase [Thermoleophilia bacterium]|nr:1-(5-phosphoribosyl)-5-[(5-phosphoribosylamino)methylideneamino]imidazole-4-carboxamide isomerase [Thermoleophilia bacterium]
MRLFPAIDIQNGLCVRLRRGDFTDATVFGNDPVEVARHWVSEGAQYLHVVDLDGAREGAPRNFEIVRRIAESVAVPVQFGGGVRDLAALETVGRSPVARLVIGTSALLDEVFLKSALATWNERLVVAVDAEGGYVRTHGWLKKSGMTAVTFAERLRGVGVREILYTDIARDGMLTGVNVPGLKQMAEATDLQLIASGGVTTLSDLRALKQLEPLGVSGVIAGRALYDGRFTVAEARQVLEA